MAARETSYQNGTLPTSNGLAPMSRQWHWFDGKPEDLPEQIPPQSMVLVRGSQGFPMALVRVRREINHESLRLLQWPGPADFVIEGCDILDRASREPSPLNHLDRPRPTLSVVVPTVGRQSLHRVLDTLAIQGKWVDEVLVVANGCDPHDVRDIVDKHAGQVQEIHVLTCPPGPSLARNAGLAHARSQLCAFVDDDVELEQNWGAALATASVRHPQAWVFTGLVLPSSADSPAQHFFECLGGFRKGFDERVVRPDDYTPEEALIHAAEFGTGANLAGRTERLREIGGFSRALGVSSTPSGGEDINLPLDALAAGGSIAYVPAMTAHHPPPATWESLLRLMERYGEGLSAVAMHRIVTGRVSPTKLARLMPRAISTLRDRSQQQHMEGFNVPPGLLRHELKGISRGAISYLRTPRISRKQPPVPALRPEA